MGERLIYLTPGSEKKMIDILFSIALIKIEEDWALMPEKSLVR